MPNFAILLKPHQGESKCSPASASASYTSSSGKMCEPVKGYRSVTGLSIIHSLNLHGCHV